MLDRPNQYNYIFKDKYDSDFDKIVRIVHCGCSDTYQFYNSCSCKIGEVMGTNWDGNLEEIKKCFKTDSVPCLEYEDSWPYFEDGRDYGKMMDDFVNSGQIQEGLLIEMIHK